MKQISAKVKLFKNEEKYENMLSTIYPERKNIENEYVIQLII